MGKKRNEKPQPTAEEKSRKEEHRLKRFLSKSAIELADSDPETKRQMVAQTFGYQIPSPAERSEGKLIAHIDDLAIKKLSEEPELRRKVTDARIRQVMEKHGLIAEGEELRRKPPSIKGLIEEAEEINELKAVMGIKEPGILTALMDPAVINSFLTLLSGFIAPRQTKADNGVLVSVRVDGKNRIVTQEELKQLPAQGHVEYLGEVEVTELNNQSKGNDETSESETSDKAGGGDGKTGDAGSGE